MSSLRKTALIAGVIYLVTFVSIPTLALYARCGRSELHRRPRPGHPRLFGGILEIIVALCGIGTAVALYPVVKRQDEGVATGLRRRADSGRHLLIAGIVTLLSVVTLRQAGVGAAGLVTGQALAAIHNWTFAPRTGASSQF